MSGRSKPHATRVLLCGSVSAYGPYWSYQRDCWRNFVILLIDTGLGQHDRVVQLRHDDGRQQPYPIGPGGQRTEQCQIVWVFECDALTPHWGHLPLAGGEENGPSSIARAQFSKTVTSKSGSVTGMVIAIRTTAILACHQHMAPGVAT
jgi:hypothetical protein